MNNIDDMLDETEIEQHTYNGVYYADSMDMEAAMKKIQRNKQMSNNSNNEKVIINTKFSSEEDITNYKPIYYKLNEKEVIKNGGMTCIGSYCRCKNKNNCDCLTKIIQFTNK
jgi:hypothetical protein